MAHPQARHAAGCFNCGTTEGTARYSFDLDLPAVDACQMCAFALGQGDHETLAALRPGRRARDVPDA